MTNKLEFNYVSYIAAPREKVWQALTDPAFTRRYWFESVVECDWKEGSTYRFWMDDENGGRREGLRGEVLKVNKPKELVYTFTFPTNEDVKDETSKVQFLLEEEEGLTKLTVRHYGFQDDSKMFEIVNSGWPVLLSGLKTLLESGRELKKTA